MDKKTQAEVAERLARVPAFSATSTKNRKVIAQMGKVLPWAEGREGVKQGSRGAAFYVVLDGTVEVTRDGAPLARLHTGDFFGETALLTGEGRNASVTALSDCTMFVLGRPAFAAAVKTNPEIALQMMSAMASRQAAVS